MKTFPSKSIFVILAAMLLAGLVAPAGRYSPGRPALAVSPAAQGGVPSRVIVMADQAGRAAQAGRQAGGRVVQDLPLIQAVLAEAPAARLAWLAHQPGIQSVMPDRRVENTGWTTSPDGYVTSTRILRSSTHLGDPQLNPAAFLADGGYISVLKNGRVLIFNPDGSQRGQAELPGGPYKNTAVVVNQQGVMVVVGEGKRVTGLDSQGTVLWTFTAAAGKFFANAQLGDDNRLFVADEVRNVYALDSNSGALLWQFTLPGRGHVVATPVLGPDGMLYLASDSGAVYSLTQDGVLNWGEPGHSHGRYLQPVQITSDGNIFLASDSGAARLFRPDGTLQYDIHTGQKQKAACLPGLDGSMFIPTETGGLLAINSDGSLRFTFKPGAFKFVTRPLLSRDGGSVFVVSSTGIVFAVDAASGAERWRYRLKGSVRDAPVMDAHGDLILGSEARDLVILSPEGRLVYRTMLADRVTQSASVNAAGDLTLRVGDRTLLSFTRTPASWDGRPDVRPTEHSHVWDLVNPVAVDVGADSLHRQVLPDGRPLQGSGVTVAVVDSGVYFTPDIRRAFADMAYRNFLGQADFSEKTCAAGMPGEQNVDHCFYSPEYSRDPFGHGTHVAGIIWNNYTDLQTRAYLGVAPDARILSIRVLGPDGSGSTADVIAGIQYAVQNKQRFNIRVLNLSLSTEVVGPYFSDPLNRAVEAAWAQGLVVVVAAGNSEAGAESIAAPGNDPYVVTVGAVNAKRTPGYWADDELPGWSASGPTQDGFIKPDLLAPGANIISFMYNDPFDPANSARLALAHPDYSSTTSLFRMSGTSMSAAVTSGVVALMLQYRPELTPDQVKFRLKASARPAVLENGAPLYNFFQQGQGRLWAPDAVLQDLPAESDNAGMDILGDLQHAGGWVDANQDGLVQPEELDPAEMAFHYVGPVGRLVSDDGSVWLYYLADADDHLALGAAQAADGRWLDRSELDALAGLAWQDGALSWPGADVNSDGAWTWGGGYWSWGGGYWSWGGGYWSWGGGYWSWGGGYWSWGGGYWSWGGGYWSWGGGYWSWGGSDPLLGESWANKVKVDHWVNAP